MKILHVCSELYPLIKTGGLADVLGSLPWAQQSASQNGENDVRVVLPLYASIAHQFDVLQTVQTFDTFAGLVTVKYGVYNGLGLYLVDAPDCFAREGNPYHNDDYEDYPDNYRRFALLSFVASALANGLDAWWGNANILHAHDWQTGLSCAYLKHWQSPVRSVFTIHNLAYQGKFAAHHIEEIDLPWSMFDVEGLEFQGQLSYLKAGLYYADHITTVSPNYAQEITTAQFGCGLEGLLATRAGEGRLHGILNGIDERVWHPKHDDLIVKNYDEANFHVGKAANKTALHDTFDLPALDKHFTVVIVARLTEQKGADIVLSALDDLMGLPLQLLVLGNGAPHLEEGFKHAMQKYPDKVSVHIDYDEALAHQIIAGGDVILLPSRFEPCGLTQLYGLKYGTLPLVRRSGGLADTVTDANPNSIKEGSATGFVFVEPTADAFILALARASAYWQNSRQWQALICTAMNQDHSWEKSALVYNELYATIL